MGYLLGFVVLAMLVLSGRRLRVASSGRRHEIITVVALVVLASIAFSFLMSPGPIDQNSFCLKSVWSNKQLVSDESHWKCVEWSR